MSFAPDAETGNQIYLFFILSVLDEQLAVQFSQRVLAHLKSKFYSEKHVEPQKLREEILTKCFEIWSDHSKQILSQRQKTIVNKNDKSSPAMNWTNKLTGFAPDTLKVWNRFSRQVRPEELSALIFTKVLGYSDDDMSRIHGVSVGTVRFRLSRAVKTLGVCIEAES